VLPVYRDFFLIEGGISTARTWRQQWRLAEICRELGFDTEAQDLYRAAAVDSQASGSCRIAAALYCNTQGDYATATELFQLEQKLDRDNPVAYQAYALMLKEQGRFEEAEVQFQQGLQADPTNGPTYQAYALMLKEQGRFEEAEVQFQQGLQADPTSGPTYQAYALMLKEQGRFEEARPLLEHTIRLQPYDVRYRIQWLNLVFYGLDAVDEANAVVKDLLPRDDITGSLRKHLRDTANLIDWRQSLLAGDAEAKHNVQRRSQYTTGS